MSEHNDASPTPSSPYKPAPGTPQRESTALQARSRTVNLSQRTLKLLVTLTPVVAPVKPPQRRSSLAFSQLLTGSPAKSEVEDETRTPNVGRKRTHAPPLTRPVPTPGHTSRIQRIFQDATVMMQLDVAYASSPAGSIDSRISPLSPTTPARALPPTTPDIKNWRYSTAPQRLTEADSDVREPFPAIEPPSSGQLPPLPDSSSPESAGNADGHHSSQLSDTQDDTSIYPAASTELDRSLSELYVNQTSSMPCCCYDAVILDESPNTVSELSSDLDIFCSPAAEAAAESARLKRALHSPGHIHATENRQHSLRCPESSAHLSILQSGVLVPGPQCPDPSVHQGIQQSKGLTVPRAHPYRRTNSRGSPLPPNKARYPVPNQHHQSSPLRKGYEMQPTSTWSHLQSHFPPPPLAEHFQPGWSNFPVQSNSPGAYSFSTEAAKITGSSAAPDSRIRDSYRTDTLTPLAKPTARYKKTGIAAMTQGVGRYYGVRFGQSSKPVQYGSSPTRAMLEIPKKRMSDPGRCNGEDIIVETDGVDLQELSPNITPYRKGREPKRPRHSSYWDRDIFNAENKENRGVEGEESVRSMEGTDEETEIFPGDDDH